MTITPHAAAPLSDAEIVDLVQLEEVIEEGLRTFCLTGAALTTIRDTRLYRTTHPTFEDYCREKWGLKRQRAYQLIEAAGITANVSQICDTPPQRESHAAPLAVLPAADQPVVWQEAVETAPEGRITAAHVERTVERFRRADSAAAPVEDVPQEQPAPRPLALVPDAVIAPPQTEATLTIIDDNLRNISRRRAFTSVLSALHKVRQEADILVREIDPTEIAPLLDEYTLTEEARLMPTVAWVQAVFDARRTMPTMRRVK
jgi:hypothetical protein